MYAASASFIPREVMAGVPMRTPLVMKGDVVSKGMVFLLAVMCALIQKGLELLARHVLLSQIDSMRWLSVPPETRRTPFCVKRSAIAAALLTICC